MAHDHLESQASSGTCLPFGKPVPLASISGTAYVTAQLLVQQVALKLSDKIYSYSPQTLGLDVAAKQWAHQGVCNIHGYSPSLLSLQTRTGAGALALGYIFSPDFDLSRRHIPQTLIAPSATLQQLRPCLDQLSLLYNLSSPFVAHVAAIDYSDQYGLVSNYESALRLAEDLGMGLVASSSVYEAQHMSLLATLLATLLPAMHIYDGTRVARETLRVVDALSESALADLYSKLVAEAGKLNPRLDAAGKTMELIRLVNDQLGTVYEPFEYHGHETPDVVLVAFGSAETQVVKQVIANMAAKLGVVNVRVYRPFIEEAFLQVVPQSTRIIAVLGQVQDDTAVVDTAAQSALFGDVLTAVNFSATSAQVQDIKYSPSQSVTPQWLFQTISSIFGNTEETQLPSLIASQQYSFWDMDDSIGVESPANIGSILSQEPITNVSFHTVFDNLVQGGIVRSDIRASKVALEAPYAVDEANVVVVGDERLAKQIDVLSRAAFGAKVLIRLSGFKQDDIEKRLPEAFRKTLREKDIALFVVDVSYSPAFEKDASSTKLLLELATLKLVRPQLSSHDAAKLLLVDQNSLRLQECADAVDLCLHKIEVAQSWADVDIDLAKSRLPSSIQFPAFAPFDKRELEVDTEQQDVNAVVKGLLFKEAYETQSALRPDVSVETSSIRVKENRRLTPLDYDRNIFHIEFDLGHSGLTYKIGEALGIHAENDEQQIDDFMTRYGINVTDLVQVPARSDPETLIEVRTAQQALMQNLDILGKPPKRFYEGLAPYATDETQRVKLEALGGSTGAEDLKRRTEVDTATYVDVLEEFDSARPSLQQLARIVSPLKRREYSIASAQSVTPTSVALMIVVVDWVDSRGRTRYGHASHYLSQLQPGATVTASVKASVMKLPTDETAPLIMAGLGTGLAPFRAFVQQRALQKAQGLKIGTILLYLGSRHQRQEYLYGEEWEAYLASGVVTLVGSAFSRDQPHKIYIQDRMRQTLQDIVQAYVRDGGSFYLCGPTWPVPDVTQVLQEAIAAEGQATGRKLDPAKEIERLKEEGRYVLEVY